MPYYFRQPKCEYTGALNSARKIAILNYIHYNNFFLSFITRTLIRRELLFNGKLCHRREF